MIEQTIVLTLSLKDGEDYVWYGDANTVGLSSRLTEAERARALEDLASQWRQSMLRVVA